MPASESISSAISRLTAQVEQFNQLGTISYNTAANSVEARPLEYDKLVILSNEIKSLQNQFKSFESSEWKIFVNNILQPFIERFVILINQHTTGLNNRLFDLLENTAQYKTHFNLTTLQPLIEVIHRHDQYIKLYKNSIFTDSRTHQEKIQKMNEGFALIHAQFNSIVLRSANHWVEELKEIIAAYPPHTLSEENFNRLLTEINDLERYQQAYRNIADSFYPQHYLNNTKEPWRSCQKERLLLIADDIQEKIGSIENLLSRKSIPMPNMCSLSTIPSGLVFFTLPKLFTGKNPFPMLIKP